MNNLKKNQLDQISSQAQWATFFLGSKFSVMPVHGIKADGLCTCGKSACENAGKHPMFKDWRNGNYFKTEVSIREFSQHHPDANFGIITDDLIVIDIDHKNGGVESYDMYLKGQLAPIRTLKVLTGSGHGSMHIFFSDPTQSFKNCAKIYPGVDIRATGGFVVCAGSKHKSGNWYTVEDFGSDSAGEVQLSVLPIRVKDILYGLKRNSQIASKENVTGDTLFKNEIPVGSRNDALARYAGALRRKGLSEEEINFLLLEKNKICNPPLGNEEVLRISKSIGRYPQGVLAEDEPNSPLPLFRELASPRPFPIDALGPILSPAARVLRASIQAPDALIGQSLLAATSMAIQAHADVEIHGRSYPTSLFLITVGMSGERKSAVDLEALRIHREVEKELIKKQEEDMKSYTSENEFYEEKKRTILNNKKEIGRKNQDLASLGPQPMPPPSEIMLMEEPTYEGIVKGYLNGRPSIGLFSDEGGRFAGGHGMNSENQLKTIAGLSGIWDGKAISRTRSADGSSKLYGKRMAMHLMLQPMASQMMTGNELMLDQGFLSRCLITHPESTTGTRFYKFVDLNGNPEIIKYRNTMRHILKMPLPCLAGSTELNPRKIGVSSKDESVWVNFYNSVESKLGDGKEFQSIRGFASKAAEHVLRIGGGLTLLENIDAREIGRLHLQSSIELVEYYLSEALRLHSSAILNPETVLAHKLLSWCRQHKEVSLVQIYQFGPNSVREKKIAKKLVEVLESHHWLKRIDGGKTIDGKRCKDVWEVSK